MLNLTLKQIAAAELRSQGLSRKQIAQKLGVTPQAVKKHFARARQRLSAYAGPEMLRPIRV